MEVPVVANFEDFQKRMKTLGENIRELRTNLDKDEVADGLRKEKFENVMGGLKDLTGAVKGLIESVQKAKGIRDADEDDDSSANPLKEALEGTII